jgi:hypothetical protein
MEEPAEPSPTEVNRQLMCALGRGLAEFRSPPPDRAAPLAEASPALQP